MTAFLFTPWDTLFLRSGRPFNQDDPGAALVESIFPPNPTTVSGALRLALAQSAGWRPGRRWPSPPAGDPAGAGRPNSLATTRCPAA